MTSLLTNIYNNGFHHSIPVQGQFELTNHCNMNCKMCYLNKSKGQDRTALSASFWIELARQAKDLGMLVLSLTGGETLLYSELTVLTEKLMQMGFLLSFNTNASLINDDWIRWFDEHPMTKINISLYGASNLTYQSLCRCSTQQYDQVIHAIDQLKAHGHNVFITNVLTPENISEQSCLKQLMADRSQRLHSAEYVYPSCHTGYKRVDPIIAARSCIDRIEADTPWMLSVLRAQLNNNNGTPSQLPVCNGAKCSFTVTYDGKLVPCVMMRHLSYDLTTGSLADGWEYLKQAMQDAPIPAKCSHCKYAGITCPACKGSLYLEQERCGSIDYLCRIAEETARLAEEKADPNIKLIPSGDIHLFSCGQ